MKLVVGLGNPGSQYADTKHNFGFWVIDSFAHKRFLQFRAGKGGYIICKTNEFMLMKPTTYMNNSGIAVNEACRYFDVDTNNVLLVYDDIDLPLGNIRYRSEGGSGGHKGVESVIYHLKENNFSRLRMGIGTNDEMRPREKYVLSPFNKKSHTEVEETIEIACESIEYYLSHTINETMNKYNNCRKEIDE